LPLARQTLATLKGSPDLRATAGCEALYHQARAEVALAEKRHEVAIGALREALAIWLDAGSRINAAHTRLRLAEILALAGDPSEAELELSSAEKAFAKMGAQPMVAHCRTIAVKTTPARRSSLSSPLPD
jgi:tetratricopeptide (TPR) repeat protein